MPWMFKTYPVSAKTLLYHCYTPATYAKLNHHFLFFLLTVRSMLNESCLALLCSAEQNKTL